MYRTLACILIWSAIVGSVIPGKLDSADQISNEDRYEATEIINKTAVEILSLRGFGTEVHFASTKDGYNIHIVRVINSKISQRKLKRPVIFNHGLLESSTIWLINSRNVTPMQNLGFEHNKAKCGQISFEESDIINGTKFLNGPMMLANNGYDVWLMSMRGTDLSQLHDSLDSNEPEFWDYSLDDFALVDVPTVVDYVRLKTGVSKVGYIGHSQATFSVFALLSTRPSYADVIEPVIAVAPVAFFDNITSIARLLFLGSLRLTKKNGPFPRDAERLRIDFVKFCVQGSLISQKMACKFIEMLIAGKGERWLDGYYNHLPFYSSLKVLRHFGQLIKSKRFMMYDYGETENLRLYGTPESPSYPIEKIRSKSLCLFSTKSDALSTPKDVNRFISKLKVTPYKNIFIDRDFDHFDLITHEDSRKLVFGPILEIFESFEQKFGTCFDEVNYNDILNANFEKELAKDHLKSNSIEMER